MLMRCRRAAEKAAAALPGGLHGKITAEEQDQVSRLSNISGASAQVGSGPLSDAALHAVYTICMRFTLERTYAKCAVQLTNWEQGCAACSAALLAGPLHHQLLQAAPACWSHAALCAPQSDDSAMSAPRKARGARRASALFANRGSPGGAMRALAAAAVTDGAYSCFLPPCVSAAPLGQDQTPAVLLPPLPLLLLLRYPHSGGASLAVLLRQPAYQGTAAVVCCARACGRCVEMPAVSSFCIG